MYTHTYIEWIQVAHAGSWGNPDTVCNAKRVLLAARGLEQEDGGDLECLVSTVAGSQEAQSGQSMVRSVEIDTTVKANLS